MFSFRDAACCLVAGVSAHSAGVVIASLALQPCCYAAD